MDRIHMMSAYFLIIRYPVIANYIQEAYNRGHHGELLDFLFEVETDEIYAVQ